VLHRVPSEKISLEGKGTRTLYRGPKERSTLEIQRNYQSALESAGFKILFTCAGSECGRPFHWIFYHDMEQRIRGTKSSGSAFDIPQDLRYVSARRVVGDRAVHVSVLIAFDAGFSKLSKQPVTLLEVIESETMDTGMVTVKAEAMSKGIDATGHIAIYGVYFDTNSAAIKEGSSPTLTEITELLTDRPSLKLLVVAPIASNDTADGRKKNRRVELVKQ